MSENVKKQIIKQERYTHEFYCDKCDKFLGETSEYDDGWYPTLGRYRQSFCIKGEWYTLEICLCDECAKNMTDDIINALQKIGFTKGF